MGFRPQNCAKIASFLYSLLKQLFIYVFLGLTMAEIMSKIVKSPRKSKVGGTHTSVDRKIVNANWITFLAALGEEERNPKLENVVEVKKPGKSTARKRKKKNYKRNLENVAANIEQIENPQNLVKKSADLGDRPPTLTKFVAMDCEMVGIGDDGKDNMLARVSLVNTFGDCLYDKFVKPREDVVDYRTSVSGVRMEDLLNAETFQTVQQKVADILKGRILVGHALKNDLAVLFLSHPQRNIRDTSRYKPFRKVSRGGTPSLKKLATELLGVQIQKGEHSSVEDARAAMQLYLTHAKQWESTVAAQNRKHLPPKSHTSIDLNTETAN